MPTQYTFVGGSDVTHLCQLSTHLHLCQLSTHLLVAVMSRTCEMHHTQTVTLHGGKVYTTVHILFGHWCGAFRILAVVFLDDA